MFEMSLSPNPCLPARAGGFDRDEVSARAISVSGASCSHGGSSAGLIKFLRAKEGGRDEGRERRREGEVEGGREGGRDTGTERYVGQRMPEVVGLSQGLLRT